MFFGLFGDDKKRNAELIEAAREGNLEKVRQLLSKGADVNAIDPESSENSLNMAVNGLHSAVVDFLIENNANVNYQSKAGYTALYISGLHGDKALPIADKLLVAGANIKLGPEDGSTPLYIAVFYGGNMLVKRLIDVGAPVNLKLVDGSTMMHAAANGGNKEVVNLFHKLGVSYETPRNDGFTPLSIAAIVGNEVTAKSLLELGAKVDSLDNKGASPLIHAISNAREKVAKLLLDNGANPNIVIINEDTRLNPLNLAVIKGCCNIVKILIDAGVSVDVKLEGSHLPIKLAEASNFVDIVAVLKKATNAKKSILKETKQVKMAEGFSNAAATVPKLDQKDINTKSKKTSSLIPIELGVYCSDLRYHEYEHGRNLPPDFKIAQALWVKSENDSNNSDYLKACKLLTKWFECNFIVRHGLSISMKINEDNEADGIDRINTKDASNAIEHAFSKLPKLQSLEVVSIDFRQNTSSSLLNKGDELSKSPEVGIVAVFNATLTRAFRATEEFSKWFEKNGTLINEGFLFQLKNEAIETTMLSDDGSPYTSSSASWSGGNALIEVNPGVPSKQFIQLITDKVRKLGESSPLLGESVHELKKLLLLADEQAIREKLDSGLDVDTKVDNEPLLKLALMVAVTANKWFINEEISKKLVLHFESLESYQSALKRIILELLNRGADVNQPSGTLSIIGVATALNDEQILQKCIEQTDSVNDMNSTPFLLAAENGDVKLLETLLAKGARINKREFIYGLTPLMLACQGAGGEDAPPLQGNELDGQLAAVKFLITNGADVNATADNGDTAIGNAVRRGNAAIVEMLLQHGAKIANALPRGQSLISLARERDHKNIIEILTASKNSGRKA